MIPATNSQILVAEDWKKIYKSFQNADFQSYDFDTLRRTAIAYLRENYPEDFNDYIDSSEFVAIIDLIAFLGQNLSFRIDLNARENFLETATRRDSILQLAQLISYNASRNVPANGFLKISAITTTDNVIDANGVNLANSVVGWNDPTNINWYQQFITILNSAMPGSFVFGKPYDSGLINGISTQQYRINTTNTDVPVFGFSKSINGTTMSFEMVGCLFAGKTYIYEDPPTPGNTFSFIFQNDNKGSGSSNTGFFVHFRQGNLNYSDFSIPNPVANELIGINANNINDTDVWLFQQGSTGNYNTLWTKVDATSGNNVIYNSVSQNIRNIYAVTSRNNDQIDLNFADGSFGDLPKGNFRLFYRQSNALSYIITSDQISGINVQIPYYNKLGQSQTLTLTLSLQYTVDNSSGPETNDSIKLKAPQQYYTQNRMITGEDYNIAPITAGTNVLKVKSVNRVASGISKYFELNDVTGKYSRTEIFATDGIIYKEASQPTINFTFTTRNEFYGILKNQVEPILTSASFKNYYFENYPRPGIDTLGLTWVPVNPGINQTRGYFVNEFGNPIQTGYFSSTNTQYVTSGALMKFVAPIVNGQKQYFLPDGRTTTIPDSTTRTYLWAKVIQVIGDGSNSGLGALNDGTGPIILTGNVPAGSVPTEIIPTFQTIWSYALETQIINLGLINRNFGLSFDANTRSWFIIVDTNLDLKNSFNLTYQGDLTNSNKDSSWMMAFQWIGSSYNVLYRTTDYLFQSVAETGFYIDATSQNYDFVSSTLVKDKISVLGNNNAPTVWTPASISIAATTNGGSLLLSNGFNISEPGSGYITVNQNTIKITGSGTGAVLFPQLTNGSITGVYVANSGTGYSTQTSAVVVASPSAPPELGSLGVDYNWQIDSSIIEPDGYQDPSKVVISFFDAKNDGSIDDPDAFINIVNPDGISPQTGYLYNFVYFQKLSDGLRYQLYTDMPVVAYPDQSVVTDQSTSTMYYFYTPDVIKSWDPAYGWVLEPSLFAKPGRGNLNFHYQHNSGEERRFDPSPMNIIDIYLLTTDYDATYRSWLLTGSGAEPQPPTTNSLEENFASVLEPIKSISDTIVYHPAKYKVLFGNNAVPALQATFKAVQNPAVSVSPNQIASNILLAIEEFFAVENWDFGQTFNFGELSAYVMNALTPAITNFVIVPKSNIVFGSLFQVTAQSDEIFVSGATINDIQVIDSLTASQINTTASIVINTIGY